MNRRRIFIASLVVFIIIFGLEYIFHNKCLASLYVQTATLWRPGDEMANLMIYGIVIYLVTSFLFTYIYARGYEAKSSSVMEGLRYGVTIGLFACLPMAGWSYITMPIPLRLALNWFAMGMLEFLIIGAAVGIIYREGKL